MLRRLERFLSHHPPRRPKKGFLDRYPADLIGQHCGWSRESASVDLPRVKNRAIFQRPQGEAPFQVLQLRRAERSLRLSTGRLPPISQGYVTCHLTYSMPRNATGASDRRHPDETVSCDVVPS